MKDRDTVKNCRGFGTPNHLSGFSLLELLVVVTVTAIVATIAQVSYQDAHLKAQVSQSREHQRLLALAVEVYKADQKHYPHAGEALLGWVSAITTPVAYLSSSSAARDPFFKNNWEFYHWENMVDDPLMDQLYPLYPRKYRMQRYGAWSLTGHGPGSQDQEPSWPAWPEEFPSYDPSNGTKSGGLIRRSHNRPEA